MKTTKKLYEYARKIVDSDFPEARSFTQFFAITPAG
jgi:hypothetical protein